MTDPGGWICQVCGAQVGHMQSHVCPNSIQDTSSVSAGGWFCESCGQYVIGGPHACPQYKFTEIGQEDREMQDTLDMILEQLAQANKLLAVIAGSYRGVVVGTRDGSRE